MLGNTLILSDTLLFDFYSIYGYFEGNVPWVPETLLARFPVSVKASAYGRRCVALRPTPKIPRRKREKPLVPRVREMWILPIISTIWGHNDDNYVIISIRFSPRGTPYNGLYGKAMPKGVPFSRLQVYWRVRISPDEVHERVGKSVLAVRKRTFKAGLTDAF